MSQMPPPPTPPGSVDLAPGPSEHQPRKWTSNTWMWIFGGAVAGLVIGAIAVVLLDSDEPSAESAPATSAPATSAPAGPVVDVGQGLAYALPEGFTAAPTSAGMQITNGTLKFYAQASVRTAGEDPIVLVQEYVNTFDSLYPSTSYSQAIPTATGTGGATATDGYTLYYRTMLADGTGFKGVITATRRPDGLAYLTDLFTALDDGSGDALPNSVATELYTSFVSAPSVSTPATLTPLAATRIASLVPALVLDGTVAVAVPKDWGVEVPGPGRVVIGRFDGQRFVAARLADTADLVGAQVASFADLQTIYPDATITPFTLSRETPTVVSFDCTFTATGADGRPVTGVVRLWVSPVAAQAFHAIASNFADTPPSLIEEEFLLGSLDVSLTQPR
jgi:hypothetical protein